MKWLRRRQIRLGTFKALVAIVAIGSLAATGWTMHQRNANQVAITTAAITTQSEDRQTTEQLAANTKSAPTVTYLHIKEWKVKIPLRDTTSSLYYVIKPNLPDVAYVSLKAISDVAPNCAADKYALGAIARLTEEEQAAFTANPNALHQPGTIHIGSYWYRVDISQAACTDGSKTMSAAVAKAAPNYTPPVLRDTLVTLAPDSTN